MTRSRFSIGQVVRQARERGGLSQRLLAKRARTAQSSIARIELGLTSPSTGTLERVLDAAGFELVVGIRPKPVLDPQLLDDVPRILRLNPEDRLREVGSINRFVAAAKHA
jgi:transcriptional regulator with XRE-family HTH domain